MNKNFDNKILHRLNLSGPINDLTPKIVIKEIIDFSCPNINRNININFSYLHIYEDMKNSKYILKGDYEDDLTSLRLIARYVNHEINWYKEKLLIAFNFLEFFERDEYEKIFDWLKENHNFTIGNQTLDNPHSLNACVLYRLHHKFLPNIQLLPSTHLEEMGKNIKLYIYLSNPKIKIQIQTNIFEELRLNVENFLHFYKGKNIIYIENLYNSPKKNKKFLQNNRIKKKILDYSQCALKIKILPDIDNYGVKTDVEAIVITALKYGLDISICKEPLVEYENIKNCSQFSPYFPIDKNLAYRLNYSNYSDNLLNPYLAKNFNPLLPIELYNNAILNKFSFFERVEINQLSKVYSVDTFIHGKQIGIKNRENTFLENLSEQNYHSVIVYGNRYTFFERLSENNFFEGVNENFNIFIGYTYGELLETFRKCQRFLNPYTNTNFSDRDIIKLEILAKIEKYPNELEYDIRKKLYREIQRIKLYQSIRNGKIQKFIEMDSNYNINEEKNKMLLWLLDLGMLMRNWSGQGEYPLKGHKPVDENTVFTRVTESLAKLDHIFSEREYEREYVNLWKIFLDLPLILYNKISGEFYISTDKEEGLTILDRINIVKGDKNLNSCIRVTSNRFISSAYYYMRLLDIDIPFHIKDIEYTV